MISNLHRYMLNSQYFKNLKWRDKAANYKKLLLMKWLSELNLTTGVVCLIINLSSSVFAVVIQEEGMSGLQFFFTLLFSILGLSVLAVIGLVLYGRWRENRRKRFYWSRSKDPCRFSECLLLYQHTWQQCQDLPQLYWNHTIKWTMSEQPRGSEAQEQKLAEMYRWRDHEQVSQL